MKKSKLKSKSKVSYGNIFKASLVSGAGTLLGIVPQLIVAILLFMLGSNLFIKCLIKFIPILISQNL